MADNWIATPNNHSEPTITKKCAPVKQDRRVDKDPKDNRVVTKQVSEVEDSDEHKSQRSRYGRIIKQANRMIELQEQSRE